MFVLREEEDPLHPPKEDVTVIECVEVLSELPSVTRSCAMLFDLICVLSLSYTFDALQKIFMETEPSVKL